MPRPRSQAPSGALGSTRRGHGARVARGRVLRPGAGSGGPEHTKAPAQLAPPRASCSAAPQQHGRLARSEAPRTAMQRAGQLGEPPLNMYLLHITLQAQIRGYRCSAEGQEGRARVEGAWGARPARNLYLYANAYAMQLQPLSPRTSTAARTRRRRGDVRLTTPPASASSGEGSADDHVHAANAATLEAASVAAASKAAAKSNRQPARASPGLCGGR